MKKIIVPAAMVCLLAYACNNAGTGTTESKDSSAVTNSDSMNKMNDSSSNMTAITTDEASSSFLMKAANGGLSEVQEGQLAGQKGTNQSVKDYAAMMVRDHTDANDKIKGLAAPRNVTLPTTVAGDEQKIMDDLTKKTGKAFDKAYIDGMVKDHQKDVKEFEEAANKVKDTDVKAFITNTLPVLKTHLDSAKAIQKRLK